MNAKVNHAAATESVDHLKAVIFDLDGVIVDTAEQHYQAWKRLADELGVYFDRKINERLKGVSRMTSLEIILERSDKDYSEAEKESLASRKNGYYVELIERIKPQDMLPGIGQFLQELKAAGIQTAVASASRNAPRVIERLQAGEYFDVIVDVTKIRKNKPDPEIFLTAAELLGAPIAGCVGIEDAEAGIQAIKGAGMFAIGIGSSERLGAANVVLSSTEELSLRRISAEFASSLHH